jgi:hypothetical protein
MKERRTSVNATADRVGQAATPLKPGAADLAALILYSAMPRKSRVIFLAES